MASFAQPPELRPSDPQDTIRRRQVQPFDGNPLLLCTPSGSSSTTIQEIPLRLLIRTMGYVTFPSQPPSSWCDRDHFLQTPIKKTAHPINFFPTNIPSLLFGSRRLSRFFAKGEGETEEEEERMACAFCVFSSMIYGHLFEFPQYNPNQPHFYGSRFVDPGSIYSRTRLGTPHRTTLILHPTSELPTLEHDLCPPRWRNHRRPCCPLRH